MYGFLTCDSWDTTRTESTTIHWDLTSENGDSCLVPLWAMAITNRSGSRINDGRSWMLA